MWSSGDPNCSEQASPTLKKRAQKRPMVTYCSLSAAPLSEWNTLPSCLTSEAAGWQGWSGLWSSARSLSILSPDELLKGCSTVYKAPHSVMDQKFFHIHQTREDLLTSFQKWRCLWLIAWLRDSSKWSQHQEPRCSMGSLLPSRQVTVCLWLRRRLGPSSISNGWKHKTLWLFFFFRYIFPPCEASEHRKAILGIDSETDQCACF